MDVFTLLKEIIFLWVILEIGLLAHLYYYASQKSKGSKVMRSVFLFLTAIGINFVHRFFLSNAATLGNMDVHHLMRDLAIIPLILVGLSARYMKNKSVQIDDVRKELKGGDSYGNRNKKS